MGMRPGASVLGAVSRRAKEGRERPFLRVRYRAAVLERR
jgi:hypothetical protein